MDQPTKGEHRNRGSLTTASLTLVPLDLKNSVPPARTDPHEGSPGLTQTSLPAPTRTIAMNAKKWWRGEQSQKDRTPHHHFKKYCGSHLLSHNHQVAVPSARMGLATGIGTVNRAFPHHYHHRKTNKPPPPQGNTPTKQAHLKGRVAVQEPYSEREHHTK